MCFKVIFFNHSVSADILCTNDIATFVNVKRSAMLCGMEALCIFELFKFSYWFFIAACEEMLADWGGISYTFYAHTFVDICNFP